MYWSSHNSWKRYDATVSSISYKNSCQVVIECIKYLERSEYIVILGVVYSMFSLYNVDIYKQKKVVWTRINGMFFEAYRILSYGKFVRHS